MMLRRRLLEDEAQIRDNEQHATLILHLDVSDIGIAQSIISFASLWIRGLRQVTKGVSIVEKHANELAL